MSEAEMAFISPHGYYDHNESNIGIAEGEAEVGYWIGKPFWNQGLFIKCHLSPNVSRYQKSYG